MPNNGALLASPDLQFFNEYRAKFPAEQLFVYAGEHVAWSPDGTRIVASGSSQEDVDEKLAALGIHFSQVVHEAL